MRANYQWETAMAKEEEQPGAVVFYQQDALHNRIRVRMICSRQEEKKWRREEDRLRYLRKKKKEQGGWICLENIENYSGEDSVQRNPERYIQEKQKLQALYFGMDRLSAREQELIQYLYLKPDRLPQRILAQKWKVSQQQISREKNRALQKLRVYLQNTEVAG